MKRKIYYTFIMLFLCIILNAQSDLPESFLNFGPGFGINYGVIGTKTVVGKKNSGLLIGLGIIPESYGMIGYTIGAQISERWLFINAGYGATHLVFVSGSSYYSIKGVSVNGGVMININSSKRLFIDIGLGYTIATEKIIVGGKNLAENYLSPLIGMGYRFGTIKKNSIKTE